MSVIDEVKQRTDIVAVIGQYISLQKAGRTLRALCPFHNEKTPSFFVSPDRQSWHCFGACSTGGDVISFVMKKENMDFGEALRLLADRAGVVIPTGVEKDPDKGKKERLKERLFKVNEAAANLFHEELLKSTAAESARKYTAKRGITAQTIAEFQLGFAPSGWEELKKYLTEKGYSEDEMLSAGLIVASEDNTNKHDRFRNKLMFPIRDVRNRVTGFGARVLDASLPKYTNSPQTAIFDKSGTLYGIDNASNAIRKDDCVVIVEGYMDVIIAHQSGFKNVVASMGTAITEKHVNILKHLTPNLILALDADSAGEEAMLRCVPFENVLESELKVIVLPDGKDPDEVIRENPTAWKGLMEKAVPVMDFTFSKVARTPPTTAKEKSEVANRLLKPISEIKKTVRLVHYVQKLANLIKVDAESLKAELKNISNNYGRKANESQTKKSLLKARLCNPREEFCLALLLRYPELKEQNFGLQADYFHNSENKEIYFALQKIAQNNLDILKRQLDESIWEHVESINRTNIPDGEIEKKYNDCVLRLRKQYLQNLELQKAEVLLSARESGGIAAELAKQEEQGIENTHKILEVTYKISRG